MSIDPRLIHIHPRKVFEECYETLKKVGARNFLKSPKYKKEFEKFVAVLFTFGVRKFTKREWYLQQIGDPPDFELMTASDRETKDKPVDHAMIELVTIPEIVDSQQDKFKFTIDILEKGKLASHYQPEKGIILLIFLNSLSGPILSEQLSEYFLTNYNNKFKNVWCLYLLSIDPILSVRYIVKQLLPNKEVVECALKEELSEGIKYPHPLLDKFNKLYNKFEKGL